jgi:SRSO17 transposase
LQKECVTAPAAQCSTSLQTRPWDEKIVIDRLQRDAAKLIGDSFEGSIHIDETGFPKQGKHSVGTQKQYCGRLGKVENCQVGLFLDTPMEVNAF